MLRGPHETLEGSDLLNELSEDADLALLLWRTVRDVVLWAGTTPNLRKLLFSEATANSRLTRLTETEIPAPIVASIDTINGMLTVPDRADSSVITICCLEIAAWSRREGLIHTATTFAQAGALASPEFAEAALHTGIAAAAASQETRAETWLRRAIGQARREKDHPAYAAALTELAKLYEQRGDSAQAVHLYRWAYRTGRRFGVRSARLQAAHGLFRITRGQDSGRAAEWALTAQKVYRPHVPGGLELLLDVARFWVDLGELDQARVALRRFAAGGGRDLSPAAQLAAWALMARAFAGKDTSSGIRATSEAWQLMRDGNIAQDVRLAAALDLVHAARLRVDQTAFTRAKREILRLAPAETFPRLAEELAALWPDNEPAPLDGAS